VVTALFGLLNVTAPGPLIFDQVTINVLPAGRRRRAGAVKRNGVCRQEMVWFVRVDRRWLIDLRGFRIDRDGDVGTGFVFRIIRRQTQHVVPAVLKLAVVAAETVLANVTRATADFAPGDRHTTPCGPWGLPVVSDCPI